MATDGQSMMCFLPLIWSLILRLDFLGKRTSFLWRSTSEAARGAVPNAASFGLLPPLLPQPLQLSHPAGLEGQGQRLPGPARGYQLKVLTGHLLHQNIVKQARVQREHLSLIYRTFPSEFWCCFSPVSLDVSV